MVSKVTLGLVLSVLGLGVALSPTLLFMFTLGTPLGDALAMEVIPSVPMYLLLSMVGVPPSMMGAYLFRKGIRELIASQVLESVAASRSEPQVEEVNQYKEGPLTPLNVKVAQANTQPSNSQTSANTNAQSVQTSSARSVGKAQKFSVKTKSEWKVCPSCGQSTELGAESCGYCGHRFPKSSSESCPVCGAPLTYARRITGDLYACGICFSELVKAAA
ncbi:MAG: zinc ribbon domain-containing protein [Thaumarchaeota archaeon]|nr:zinc ribbon domain-containing protein [Candidatus Calditenuaceae archaeon]MDW8186495.1 zinc ribbon domain-containing protein [Nitrososphaerota archaeon]